MGQNGFFGIHTICLKVFRCTFKASGVGGGGAGGGSLPKKLLVWWISGKNPLKSGKNLCKFGQNVRQPWQNRLCALILQKWRPKSKCRRLFFLEVMFLQFFFGQVRGNMGKFGGNLGKNGAWSALIRRKCAQNGMRCSHFLKSFALEFFSDKFSGKQTPLHPQ